MTAEARRLLRALALTGTAVIALATIVGWRFVTGRDRVGDVAAEPPSHRPRPRPRARLAKAEVDTLVDLLARSDVSSATTPEERQSWSALEARLLARGDEAVAAIVARLDRGVTAAERDRLFNALRRVPGPAAEAALAREARRGPQPSTRTMAIEALAERRTEGALATLIDIARADPDVPAHPLLGAPRRPDDTSTELPDEQVFTPRMQAMAALASTATPQAAAALADVAHHGPDESLRMEAARNLGLLRTDARAVAALREAAATDPSALVRLAAVHALAGSPDTDGTLSPLLARIAEHDSDAGVRKLAQAVRGPAP